MYDNLQDLCHSYLQDFESVGQTNTEPVDMFCDGHSIDDQKQLLAEMKMFLQEVHAGTKTAQDLSKMGIGYNQSLDGSWDWFKEAMEYLKKKIAEG